MIAVHQSKPAPPIVAGWLNWVLAPAVQAARFDAPPPPVELRPVGRWGGQCEPNHASLVPNGEYLKGATYTVRFVGSEVHKGVTTPIGKNWSFSTEG